VGLRALGGRDLLRRQLALQRRFTQLTAFACVSSSFFLFFLAVSPPARHPRGDRSTKPPEGLHRGQSGDQLAPARRAPHHSWSRSPSSRDPGPEGRGKASIVDPAAKGATTVCGWAFNSPYVQGSGLRGGGPGAPAAAATAPSGARGLRPKVKCAAEAAIALMLQLVAQVCAANREAAAQALRPWLVSLGRDRARSCCGFPAGPRPR